MADMSNHTSKSYDSEDDTMDFTELPAANPCGCGSGKPYGKCCQKAKRIKYGTDAHGDICRIVPVNPDLIETLNELTDCYRRLYGREPRNEDSVLGLSASHADSLSDSSRVLLRAGAPVEKVYAYHMSEGQLPTEKNMDLMPDKDLAEYEQHIRDFESMKEEFSQAGKNPESVTEVPRPIFITYCNELLDALAREITNDLKMVLNDFLARSGGAGTFLNFEIRQPLDYALFSVYKTLNILNSISRLAEEDLTESIYALSRSLLENYLYLKAITIEPDLFVKSILPKADRMNFKFATKKNGEVNYYKVLHRKTGKEHNIQIKMDDLLKISGIAEDKSIYQLFFYTASQYIHVDVLSARAYFHESDPFEELNPASVAWVFSLALVGMILEPLPEIAGVDKQLKADYAYFHKSLFKRLSTLFMIADSDPEYRNDACQPFLDRISVWDDL